LEHHMRSTQRRTRNSGRDVSYLAESGGEGAIDAVRRRNLRSDGSYYRRAMTHPAGGSLASGRRTGVDAKCAFAFDAHADDPFRSDAEDRRVEAAANGFAASR